MSEYASKSVVHDVGSNVFGQLNTQKANMSASNAVSVTSTAGAFLGRLVRSIWLGGGVT